MNYTIISKGLIVVLCIISIPHFAFAGDGKPSIVIKMDYAVINQIVADNTFPAPDKKASKEKEEKAADKNPVEEVKVIPKARRQAIPLPVKVNIQPVKIIKPKIIKPVIKSVIKILH